MMPGGKCRIKGKFCHAWSDFDGCGLVRCKFVESAEPIPECKHEFVYSELQNEFVCKNCFFVMTRDEKRELLTFANNKRKAEEKKMRSLTEVEFPIEADLTRATKPKTNADHIRSMTDEELAKFILMGLGQYVSCFAEGMFPHHPCPAHNNCLQCGVEWLGQPFDENVWPGLKEG